MEAFRVLIIKDEEVFQDCYEYAKSKGFNKSEQEFTHSITKSTSNNVLDAQIEKYNQLKNNISNLNNSIFSYPPDNFNVAAIIFSLLFGLQ